MTSKPIDIPLVSERSCARRHAMLKWIIGGVVIASLGLAGFLYAQQTSVADSLMRSVTAVSKDVTANSKDIATTATKLELRTEAVSKRETEINSTLKSIQASQTDIAVQLGRIEAKIEKNDNR